MAGLTLHLIRHPAPQIAPGICYGQLDLPAESAAPIAARLRAELPPHLPLWSSPLRRCRELALALHPAPIFDERLREINFGAWEGRPWADIPRHELDAWAADIANYTPPGGESPSQLQHRALAFIATLDTPEAMLVTHAGIIRALNAAAIGKPISACLDFSPAYGGRTVLRLNVRAVNAAADSAAVAPGCRGKRRNQCQC
ncbi:MAG: alpha-ribazole phosphatase family protein [Azonexus sp.]|jgi:alpha-ribazole phosphatase|nr:alpha-ribazole phosphatase family protein [Azonexus sp.]